MWAKKRLKLRPNPKDKDTGRRKGRLCAWILLLAVLAFVAAVRIRLVGLPLERDEGEYAYAGQIILQGIPPYVYVYNMKFPGIYAAYALILAIFGQTHVAVRIGLLLVNICTIILVFLLAERLFDTSVGVMAAAAFGVMSLNHYVLGMFAHATHFVTLFAVAGMILLLKALESEKHNSFFWSGVCLGLSVLMKQPAVFFCFFAVLYAFIAEWRNLKSRWLCTLSKQAWLLGGMVVPVAVTMAVLASAGAFRKFWFWTVKYGAAYVTQNDFSAGLVLFQGAAKNLFQTMPSFWILALAGIIMLFAVREWRNRALFLIGLFVFSFLATCPGMYFRGHYFIVLLPAVVILVGVGASGIGIILRSRIRSSVMSHVAPATVFVLSLILCIAQERAYLFSLSPVEVSRKIYGIAPFPESYVIGRYIREHTRESDRIAVLGSEPQIYFYARRRSATGYIYMYPLMENHSYAASMQRELISEVERAKPEYVVFVNISTSWMRTDKSPMILWNWLQGYCLGEYDPVGCAEAISDNESIFIWGKDLEKFVPQSKDWTLILRRKH